MKYTINHFVRCNIIQSVLTCLLPSAVKTSTRLLSDLLMDCVSLRRALSAKAPDLSSLSLPARSTRFRTPFNEVFVA